MKALDTYLRLLKTRSSMKTLDTYLRLLKTLDARRSYISSVPMLLYRRVYMCPHTTI